VFDQILFPTDGSEGAGVALEHVLDVATHHEATVHVLTVADTTGDGLLDLGGDDVDAREREATRVTRETAEDASDRGVDAVTAVRRGEPYREIVDYAETEGMDLVVLPTQGRRGLERFLLGSTTERVVRRSDVPVLTVRPDDDVAVRHPYEDVLVPTDGSDCANQALAIGVDVADAEDTALHLLSVVPIPALGADPRPDVQLELLEESATDLLNEAAEFATDAGVEPASTTVEIAPAIHQAILGYVDEHDVDLVVAGTHGRTGLDRYVLGSVTDSLVRTSPVPVLTVRGPLADA
jgi:nucleotide-binding universal stress UspA family protein